jgi:hypothetical protein
VRWSLVLQALKGIYGLNCVFQNYFMDTFGPASLTPGNLGGAPTLTTTAPQSNTFRRTAAGASCQHNPCGSLGWWWRALTSPPPLWRANRSTWAATRRSRRWLVGSSWAVAILAQRRGGPSYSWRVAVVVLSVTPASQQPWRGRGWFGGRSMAMGSIQGRGRAGLVELSREKQCAACGGSEWCLLCCPRSLCLYQLCIFLSTIRDQHTLEKKYFCKC